VVNRVDRLVSPRADALVRTRMFADTVAALTRLEVQSRRRLERQTTWLLHAYNLPSASDAQRILARLSAIEARVRDLAEQLEEEREAH
jgi:hypothetical protein